MPKLDLNLASRPFVNERPLRTATLVLALLVALGTFWNVRVFFSALKEVRTLGARVAALEAEMEAASQATRRSKERRGEKEKQRVRTVTQRAATIIHKRQLSWSRLLDQLEAILPRDVRVQTVLPEVKDSQMLLLLDCVARDNEAKLKFYRKLHEEPFRDAYLLGESIDESGIRFNVRCRYDPQGPAASPILEPMPWERVELRGPASEREDALPTRSYARSGEAR